MFTVIVIPCTVDGMPCHPSVHTFNFACFANAYLATLAPAYAFVIRGRNAIAVDALALA